jgi:UDP-glucose 4-epimerase
VRRVLVTGGSGFIGTSVVAALAGADDVDLVVSADLRDPAERREGITYTRLDVTDPHAADALVAEHRPTVVVHLAAIVNPDPSMPREKVHQVDVDGTRNVLDACVRHGVGQVVVSSSGAAYGYHPDNPEWIREDDALRGNEEFAYSHHKRLVEEMLAVYRERHPALGQTVLRIGTVLGETVDNQITALFERPRLLKVRGSDSPFVFVWDTDLVEVLVQSVLRGRTGIFNVAGDGAMTVDDIAAELGKPVLAVPDLVLKAALAVGRLLRLTPYGPEQTRFLRYRPVLDNARLKAEFPYTPSHTSREAFAAWRAARGV